MLPHSLVEPGFSRKGRLQWLAAWDERILYLQQHFRAASLLDQRNVGIQFVEGCFVL